MEISNEDLMSALNENTAINKELLELLKLNNKHTDEVWKYIKVQLSPEQQWKDFGANIAANIIGNSVSTPTLINLNK